MRRNFTFDLVDPEDAQRLQECRTKQELFECLSSTLTRPLADVLLSHHPEEKWEGLQKIFLDCCVLVCEKFLLDLDSCEKVSVAVQIVFDSFVTSFSEKLTKAASLDHMCDALNRHAAPEPPRRFMVFDLKDIKAISSSMVDHFYASYDQYYSLFATVLITNFRWGPANTGRFPQCLPLDYGKPVESPRDMLVIKQLYYSQKAEDELDDVEMEELLKGMRKFIQEMAATI